MLLNLQAKSNSIILLSKFIINCAKLILGVLTGNDSVKNIIRMFGPQSGVIFELW